MIIDKSEQIKSCIANLGFDGMSEKLFEVYSKCSTVSTRGMITNYQTVSNVGDCFKNQYPSLSNFVASKCIPKVLKKSFLDCMDSYKDNFLSDVKETYQKVTLWFNGNTLGQGFQSKLEYCSIKALADGITHEKFFSNPPVLKYTDAEIKLLEKFTELTLSTNPVIEIYSPRSVDNSTYLYIATTLGVIAITTYILWKISHRNHEQH